MTFTLRVEDPLPTSQKLFVVAATEMYRQGLLPRELQEKAFQDVVGRYAAQLESSSTAAWSLHCLEEELFQVARLADKSGLYPIISLTTEARQHSIDALCAAAVAVDVPYVQLRAKGISARQFLEVGRRVHALVGERLVINDRPDIARALGCGVHLGLDDLPLQVARDIVGPDAVVGSSSHSEDQFRSRASQATYCALGPIYVSQTKQGHADTTGTGMIRNIRDGVDSPICVIGGIDSTERVLEVSQAGADLVALVSAFGDASHPALRLGLFTLAFVIGRRRALEVSA